MSYTIPRHSMAGRKAFTLIEVMTASLISLYILMSAWSIYIMGWSWWSEMHPWAESQSIARSAIASIIEGRTDTTAGTYMIGTNIYKRRNGIAQATAIPTIATAQRINFRLEPDSSNLRSFYMGVDETSGLNVIYYQNNAGTISAIKSTLGMTDILFEKYMGLDNMIQVTATVERDVLGTRSVPYHVKVVYSGIAYLRSVTN